jgi:hypothetical protein
MSQGLIPPDADAPYYEYYFPGYASPYPYVSGGGIYPVHCSNGYHSMGYNNTYPSYHSHLSSTDESAASLGSEYLNNRRRLSKKRGKEKKYVPTMASSGDYDEAGSLLSLKGELVRPSC